MKKIAAFSCAALLLICAAFVPAKITASANSAPPYWEGVSSSGVVVSGGQCPVEVEKEVLTFNVPDFPSLNPAENNNYSATVTAQYTFFNPTELDVSMKLLFPIGGSPDYGHYESGDLSHYSVKADGEEVETTFRHTYYGSHRYGGGFDVDNDMASVRDGYAEDEFYSPELTVTPVTYEVTLPEKRDRDINYVLRMEFEYNSDKTHICTGSQDRSSRLEDGRIVITFWLRETHETVTFWVYGETPYGMSASVTDSTVEHNRVEGATCVLSSKQSPVTTFGETVAAAKPENVSDVDWYNAVVDYLNDTQSYDGVVGRYGVFDLLRWFEYELQIPAGGRLVNTVSAPLYPSIDGASSPDYRYEYYLSPARKWADFKKIEIYINTPYYLRSDSSLEFTKTESGYYFTRNALPMGDLSFALGEKEALPTVGGTNLALLITVGVIGGFVLLGGLLCAIIIPIVVSCGRNKRKQNENRPK